MLKGFCGSNICLTRTPFSAAQFHRTDSVYEYSSEAGSDSSFRYFLKMGSTAITAGKLFSKLLFILLMAYFIVKVKESFVKLDHEEWLMCVGHELEIISF